MRLPRIVNTLPRLARPAALLLYAFVLALVTGAANTLVRQRRISNPKLKRSGETSFSGVINNHKEWAIYRRLPLAMDVDSRNGQLNSWYPRRSSGTWTPTVSVVIPTLNEEENIRPLLAKIPAWVDEVMLVDGLSTDGTIRAAREVRPDVRVVTEQRKGKGAALRRGFEEATGDIVVMLDADNSMDPGEIPAYIGALLAGADFVKGSRFLQGAGTSDMPFYRKAGNWGFVVLVRLFFGGRYSDLCYGYSAFWRRLLPALDLDGDGFEIETMMNVRALRAGLKVVEVPSFEDKRMYGESRLKTFPDGWRVLMTIFRERFARRQRKYRAADAEVLRRIYNMVPDSERLTA